LSEPALALEEALAATATALDAGDAAAAAEASSRAARLCAELESAGVRLEPDLAARLCDLQARCQVGAAQVMERLGADLSLTARSTRAGAAYRR
jgi:hypothetical protein